MATLEPDLDERDGLAAEYALGTLAQDERDAADILISSDLKFARQVHRWEKRLDILLDAVPETFAPAFIFDAITRKINEAEGTTSAEIIRLRQRVRLWQSVTVDTIAIAASLIFFISIYVAGLDETRFVAILEGPDRTPAFVASIDVNKKQVSIKRVAARPETGRSYELWAIAGQSKPQAIGLVNEDVIGLSVKQLTSVSQIAPMSDVLLAVTLEPEGGSPTGQPTSAPIYTGKLVEAPQQ